MSYYSRGLSLGSGISVGAMVATPGYIREQVALLGTFVLATDRDVAAQAGTAPASTQKLVDSPSVLDYVAAPGIASLTDYIRQKQKDAQAAAEVPGPGASQKLVWYQTAWLPFLHAWTTFAESHQGWTDNMWGSVIETANAYRQQLIDLRASARASGFQLRSPEPPEPDAGWMSNLGGETAKILKTLVWAVVLLGGAWVLFKFVVPLMTHRVAVAV